MLNSYTKKALVYLLSCITNLKLSQKMRSTAEVLLGNSLSITRLPLINAPRKAFKTARVLVTGLVSSEPSRATESFNVTTSTLRKLVRLVIRGPYEYFRDFAKRTFGFSFYYLQGLALLLFVDACLTDDEPLWEPIE